LLHPQRALYLPPGIDRCCTSFPPAFHPCFFFPLRTIRFESVFVPYRATVYPRTFPSPCFFVSTEDDRVEKKGRVSPRNQITPASTNSGASPAKPASGKFLFGVGLATAAGAVGVGDVGGAVVFEEPEAAGLALIEAMGESNISVCGHQRYSIGHLVLKSNKHSQEKDPVSREQCRRSFLRSASVTYVLLPRNKHTRSPRSGWGKPKCNLGGCRWVSG